MKKILALSIVAIATAVGCASPSEQLCVKNYECQGEDDPAGKCAEDKADADEEALKCSEETCKAEADALATCTLDTGECTDIAGTEYFISEDCGDETDAFVECAADC